MARLVGSSSSTIESMPVHIVTEILALVGSFSFDDLYNAKLSCKMFNEVAGYNVVYKKVSLKKFQVNPWQPSEGLSRFIRRCNECENPEALFRQGVIDFFSLGRHNEGLQALEKAANDGHGGALYTRSVIFLLSGDMEAGIQLLSGMRTTKEAGARLKECRDSLKAIMASIWITNPIVRTERPSFCAMQGHHKWRSGWEIHEDEVSCDACRRDREMEFVYGLFPRS